MLHQHLSYNNKQRIHASYNNVSSTTGSFQIALQITVITLLLIHSNMFSKLAAQCKIILAAHRETHYATTEKQLWIWLGTTDNHEFMEVMEAMIFVLFLFIFISIEYKLLFVLRFLHQKIIQYKFTVAHFTCFVTRQSACMCLFRD